MTEGAGRDQTAKPLATTSYRVELGGQTLVVAVIDREDGRFVRIDDGPERRVETLLTRDDGELAILFGSAVLRGLVARHDDDVVVSVQGHSVTARVADERAARLASAASGGRHRPAETAIRAPMPGMVVAVPVTPGESVSRGATLVVLSAMKMQNELTAPADGTIKEILVTAGQTVDQNHVLVRME